MYVEKCSDELRLGVKGQSKSVIAGSPRNASRSSLGTMFHEGRALNGLGAPPGYRTQSNSESHEISPGVSLRAIRSWVERETTQIHS